MSDGYERGDFDRAVALAAPIPLRRHSSGSHLGGEPQATPQRLGAAVDLVQMRGGTR